jgi:flagellar biogenesis protein FliO
MSIVAAPAIAFADAASTAAPALEFRHDDAAASSQGVMALIFVAVLAAAAWGIVYYFRQTGRSPLNERVSAVRIVQFKRLTPKLSVVTVSIDGQRTVIFADNGQALLLLASESKGSPSGSTQEPSA